jgi:hypothetical protein
MRCSCRIIRDEVGALAMKNLRQGIFSNTIDRFDSLIRSPPHQSRPIRPEFIMWDIN